MSHFKYLGSIITQDNDFKMDTRIQMGNYYLCFKIKIIKIKIIIIVLFWPKKLVWPKSSSKKLKIQL